MWVIMKTLKIYCEIQKERLYQGERWTVVRANSLQNVVSTKGLESRENLLATLIKKGNGYKRSKGEKDL